MLAAVLRYAIKTCTDFNAFDSVNAHHSIGNFCIEAVKNRFSQADRDVGCFDMKFCADRIQ